MNRNEFRVWDKKNQKMYYSKDKTNFVMNMHGELLSVSYSGDRAGEAVFIIEHLNKEDYEIMFSLGLKDEQEKTIYERDILEFDKYNRIIIKREEWFEFCCEPISDENNEEYCEDMCRDLYRIERAKIIGNEFENKELLEIKEEKQEIRKFTQEEAIDIIDILLNKGVIDFVEELPKNPKEKDLYIYRNDMLVFLNGAWLILCKTEGIRVWINSKEKLYQWKDNKWKEA